MNIKGVNIHGPSVGAGCVLGVAAGVAGSFTLFRLVLLPKLQREFDKQVDGRVSQEAAVLRSHYNDRLKESLAGVVSGNLGTDGSTNEGSSALGRRPEREPVTNYAGIRKVSGPPSPVDARLEGVEDDDDEQHTDASGADEAEIHNVFEDHPAGDFPKIRRVNRDEFGEVPAGYTTEVLTWYAGDGVLCDEKDDPIRSPLALIGTEKPLFGYLAEDPHVYLVVNEELDLCLEVVYKESSYVDAVLDYGSPGKKRESPA
jgi:hypothetical protein